jgi:mutator protein MutT
MKECTLLLLIRGDEILLAMKKRGFGAGRWNGVGGKIEPGETIEQAAIRECEEEIMVTPGGIRKVALLDFAFPDGTTDMRGHVFVTDSWTGEPAETEEMAPQWFQQAALPFDKMWDDDKFWMQHVLDGKLVRGTFVFDEQEKMLSHSIEFDDQEQLTA